MPALALGLLAGCLLQLQQARLASPGFDLGLGALACVLLVAALGCQQRRCRPAASLLLSLAAVAAAVASTDGRARMRLAQRLPAAAGVQLRVVEGHVAELPAIDAGGARFVFVPLASAEPRLLVGWASAERGAAPPMLLPGQRWRLPLRIKPVHGRANPHGDDAELRALERGIGASASVSHSRRLPPPQLLGRSDSRWLLLPRLRAQLRQRMRNGLGQSAQAGSVIALALGDQAAIPAHDWALYRRTGIAHLVSISGLHITLLSALLGSLGAACWRRLRWRQHACALWLATPDLVLLLRVLVAIAYALLAGLGVPAQRAVLMLLAASGARARGLAPAWWQSMAWALTAVLLWDPWAALAPGFWLSFVAVAMLFIGDRAAAGAPDAGSRLQQCWQRLRAATRAQLSLSLTLAPITLLFFQQVAWVGPLANAAAIPLVTLVTVPLSLLGLLLPQPLDAGCWRLAAGSMQILHLLLRALAGLPQPGFALAAPSALPLLLAGLGGVVLALDCGWRLRCGGLLLMLPVFSNPGSSPRAGHVEAWVADVGQGSAVLVRTAHHALLFDTGPALAPGQDAGTRVLLPLMRGLGLARLDRLLLSHADNDHIGGAAAVAQAYAAPPTLASVPAARLRQLGLLSAQPCVAGQRWRWDGVDFSVVHPPRADDGSRHSNATSCVLRVASAHGSLLLTGDIGRAQERSLARGGQIGAVDLLLAPHHGSATSSSTELLLAARPRAVAIQVGFANPYGHPHPHVLQRLLASGAQVYRSDRDGALHWHDTQPGVLCSWRAQRPRYWRLAWPGQSAVAGCAPG